METVDSVSIHRLREALGPEEILPVTTAYVALEGNDYHKVYVLALTPEQHKRIVSAVTKRGVI